MTWNTKQFSCNSWTSC